MKLLVLGGTRFLSRETATQAVARGWDVTCACRGESGPVPDGATHLPWDRDTTTSPAAIADGGLGRRRRRDPAPLARPSRGRGDRRRALGVRLDDQRLPRQLLPRHGSARRPDHRGRGPRRRPRGLRRHEGRVRAGRAGARRVVGDRPARPHRRPRRPDRTLRLLAAAAGARRRGAGARPPDDAGPGDRRTRPRERGCSTSPSPAPPASSTRSGSRRPFADLLAGVAAGVGSPDPDLTWVEPDFLEAHDVAALGRRRLTAAVAAATGVRRHAGARPRSGRGRRAAAAPGRRDRTRLPRLPRHRADRASGRPRCWPPGTPADPGSSSRQKRRAVPGSDSIPATSARKREPFSPSM